MAGEDAWWVLSSSTLRSVLVRAAEGEDAEMLYLELFANADAEEVEGNS